MKSPGKQILGYVRRRQGALWIATALSVAVGLLEAATPFLISGVFETWLNAGGADGANVAPFGIDFNLSHLGGPVLLALLIGATLVKVTAEYGAVGATAWLGQSVVRDIRNDVFARILKQPLQFFLKSSTGELISRVSTDIERVQAAASDTLAEFLKQSAILVFLTTAIFIIDWRLSLGSLILIPLVFYPTVWFGRKLRSLSRSNQQELAEMSNVVGEAFAGNRIVKAFLMEETENRRFQEVTRRLSITNLKQKMTHALSSPMMEGLGMFAAAGFVLYAHDRQMKPGFLVAFILALVKLYDGLRRMSGINNTFQQAVGASSRIFEILALPSEPDTGRIHFAGFKEAIELRGVEFGYTPETPVLQGINLRIGKGEVVAIVGASGSGKSTLVNLLPRFFDVSNGVIRIDGVDIREVTIESLRRQFAIVTQDVILFDDTIRRNIAYGDPSASSEKVIAAAKAALVDDFVAALPERYETRVGERGLRLSGGERQRISIARALLKDAPVLILDEATSSLDAESEAGVQMALQNLMVGRTTVVIAHRLSTVRRADRIVVLQDGRVAESGTHDALLARRGAYWKLHNVQIASQEFS